MNSLTKIHRVGTTLPEVLAVTALGAVALAVTIPALGEIGCSAKRATSRENLATLAQAYAAYGADWNGRQFTMVPDEVGAFGGCAGYLAAGNCIPDVSLGLDCEAMSVAFPIGCGPSASCENFAFANPIEFSAGSGGFGAHRIPNAAGFQPYVDGRFYSPTFYAPDDAGTIEGAEPYFASRCGYAAPANETPVWSSYTLSPAAMLNWKVLSRQTGYHAPSTLADGFTSPPFSEAMYPSLKTHIIELHTIENAPSPCNPYVEGCVPFTFNQVYESRPLALLYDGSVRIVSPRATMESDLRVRALKVRVPAWVDRGLWSRSTPFGPYGVGGQQANDWLVDTSYHFLTGDGIRGRDFVAD